MCVCGQTYCVERYKHNVLRGTKKKIDNKFKQNILWGLVPPIQERSNTTPSLELELGFIATGNSYVLYLMIAGRDR